MLQNDKVMFLEWSVVNGTIRSQVHQSKHRIVLQENIPIKECQFKLYLCPNSSLSQCTDCQHEI